MQTQPNTTMPVAVVVNPGPARATTATRPATGTTAGTPAAPAGPPNRLLELARSIPLATCALLVLNVGVFGWTALWPVSLSDYSISAYHVLWKLQFYRLVSSAFMHGGVMHIGMNMMSLYYMGTSLERLFGTVQFFVLTAVFVALGGLLYVGGCTFASYVLFRDMSWLVYSSVGFSGVLFSYAVQESSLSAGATRSLFGFVNVPTKYYPWAMLIALQVLMPSVSLAGHLGGLLCGLAHIKGWLVLAVPSRSSLVSIEGAGCLAWMRRLPNFVPTTDSSFPVPATRPAAGAVSIV